MINIVEKFLELYETNQIEINWNKANLSFNFEKESNVMPKILEEVNYSQETENKMKESDIVDYFFAIIANRLDEYYNNNIIEDAGSKEITEYIEEKAAQSTLDDIQRNIFLDNTIYNNRLNEVKYEILTKRDEKDIDKIKGYTSKVILQITDSQYQNKSIEIELKSNELEELIIGLTKVKKDVDKLINGKE